MARICDHSRIPDACARAIVQKHAVQNRRVAVERGGDVCGGDERKHKQADYSRAGEKMTEKEREREREIEKQEEVVKTTEKDTQRKGKR